MTTATPDMLSIEDLCVDLALVADRLVLPRALDRLLP